MSIPRDLNPYTGVYIDPEGKPNDAYEISLVECSTAIGCGANSPNAYNERYYQIQIIKNGINTGQHFGGSLGAYSATIQSIRTVYDSSDGNGISGYAFTIDGANGRVYERKNLSACPIFLVACGEDCPPGYCKCECVNYPGYCCYDNNGNPLR